MIEIKANLIRGFVYLTGETLECLITFSNPPIPDHKTSQSNSDTFESLAWASAQIHCQCSTDNKASTPNTPHTKLMVNSETATALSPTTESGHIEVATNPKILFCDLRLSPGESKTYLYQEVIPIDAPPSYRGQAVKYTYKIIIGTQRVNSPINFLRVPFKVLPLSVSGLSDAAGLCNETTEELTPTNPFLYTKPTETPLELALQGLQNITARRTPNFYMITNSHGKVVRFCLFKNSYKLGEDIVGTFDFSVATVKCVQVSVSLQCEEESTFESKNKETTKRSRIITYNKHHEVCLGLKHSQLILPVPLHVTPAFVTPLVTLKWRLHFEFVTSTCKGLSPLSLDQCGWQAPAELNIETMVWSLPIRIFSTTPLQVSLALQNSSLQTLTIQ